MSGRSNVYRVLRSERSRCCCAESSPARCRLPLAAPLAANDQRRQAACIPASGRAGSSNPAPRTCMESPLMLVTVRERMPGANVPLPYRGRVTGSDSLAYERNDCAGSAEYTVHSAPAPSKNSRLETALDITVLIGRCRNPLISSPSSLPCRIQGSLCAYPIESAATNLSRQNRRDETIKRRYRR